MMVAHDSNLIKTSYHAVTIVNTIYYCSPLIFYNDTNHDDGDEKANSFSFIFKYFFIMMLVIMMKRWRRIIYKLKLVQIALTNLTLD